MNPTLLAVFTLVACIAVVGKAYQDVKVLKKRKQK